MRRLVLIVHNLRSSHNVGSLLRTSEGLGVERVYLTGYTPYPLAPHDSRLPHIARRVAKQIAKTALGADTMLDWQHRDNIDELIRELTADGFTVVALEQAANSVKLPDFEPPEKIALVVGREVEGIEAEVLAQADRIVEIPMFGHKESFNVVQAAAMALYKLRFD
ncbi:MAG TPA: TrmH family RNA methyltransferase [Candidatus Saccharimonadales bacterium]|nr:TrmH family RNA methyltransferase [Candidatus Saccharimonadales bacterium]